MKGSVTVRIPQRIYEFLEIRYDWEGEAERNVAIESAVVDAIVLNKQIEKKNKELTPKIPAQEPDPRTNMLHEGVLEIKTVDSIDWRRKKTGWEYYDEKERKWKTEKDYLGEKLP